MRIAAIDQGTTSTRVLVASTNGEAEIRHAVRHRQIHPRSGWVEHDPEELIANILACLAAAGRVDAIGIDNQGESCLAWDARTGEALSPVIVWQDNRTSDRIARLEEEGHAALTLARAGLPLDAYFSAAKLGWILENNDRAREALQKGRLKLGTTDAFFLDRLAGTFATDITTASRTSLMNIHTGTWDSDLCALFGVPMACLPEIRPTIGRFGRIGDIPVMANVVDQQAALYGHGCRQPGDTKITFGTGAFALAVTGTSIIQAPDQGLLPTIAWGDGTETFHALDGGVYDAGSAIEWAQRLGLVGDLAELDHFDGPSALSRGLCFVPALSGLACPHWDRSAAGLFLGMSGATTRQDLQQALLEGIALRAAEVVEAMAARLPISTTISIDGGLARSHYFVQFLADQLQRELDVSDFDERTAFGTAALAGRALGAELALPRHIRTRTIPPRATDRDVARARFAEAVKRSQGWRVT
nr:FGGY family carbohydrate kinase [uncultured Gellertiella sp.]